MFNDPNQVVEQLKNMFLMGKRFKLLVGDLKLHFLHVMHISYHNINTAQLSILKGIFNPCNINFSKKLHLNTYH